MEIIVINHVETHIEGSSHGCQYCEKYVKYDLLLTVMYCKIHMAWSSK